MMRTWSTETYIEADVLVAALAATCEALGVPTHVQLADEALRAPRRTGGSVIVDDDFDEIRLELFDPVVMRGLVRVSGFELELDSDSIMGNVEATELLVAYLATLLDACPDGDDHGGDGFVEDLRSRLALYLECPEEQVNVRAHPGAVAPVVVKAWVDGPVLHVDVEGAGTNVRLSSPVDSDGYYGDEWREELVEMLEDDVRELLPDAGARVEVLPTSRTEIQSRFREVVARRTPHSTAIPPEPGAMSGMPTLQRWFEEVGRLVDRLQDVHLHIVQFLDDDDYQCLSGTLDPETELSIADVPLVLDRLSYLAEHIDRWQRYRGVVLTGLWTDDSSDMFVDGLVEMLGLPAWPDGPWDQSEKDRLAPFNRAAEVHGIAKRLYAVPGHPDVEVVLCLRPPTYQALVRRGLVSAL